MSYSFGASDCKKIENHTFDLPSSSSGEKWVGFIPEQEKGQWPRAGAEAVCLRVVAEEVSSHRRIESVIKIFKQDLPGRAVRQPFLVRQRLAKHYAWMFQCAPYSSFNAAINGVPVIGHLSRYVGGGQGGAAEDFDRLKQGGLYDGFTPAQRRHFVADLATAVLVLEAKGLVHGDLSDGNVLIAPVTEVGRHALVLCDFDGFHHAGTPQLPRKKRPLGSTGYVAPFFMDQVSADAAKTDDSIHVASDRFALAVLACELVCWQEGDGDALAGRDRLLDNDATLGLRDGSWSVPEAMAERWPEGFALLKQAAQASGWSQLPSPRAWLRLVGLAESVQNLPFQHQPFLKYRRAGQESATGWRRARLVNASGSLQPLNNGLKGVTYRLDDRCLEIDVPAQEVAMIGPIGRAMHKVTGPARLGVNPETRIVVGGLELHVLDAEGG